MRSFVSAAMLCALLSACTSSSTMPDPVTTAHVSTESAGFTMDGRPRKLRYAASYRFIDLASGSYTAVATFENPSSPEHPLRATKSFTAPTSNLSLESPALSSIRSGQNYTVRLDVYRGKATGKPVDTHVQQVRFAMPAEVARALDVDARIE